MTRIFAKAPPQETKDAMDAMRTEATLLCKHKQSFTEEEMRITMPTWKNRRATGVDGIAQEALRAMFRRPRVAELLDDCFYFYRGDISECIAQGASVLLQTLAPTSWAETRPITLSNALLKWLSQLLLLRGNPVGNLLPQTMGQQKQARGRIDP